MAVIAIAGFQHYASPNHLDDASNHAFMAHRIADRGGRRAIGVHRIVWERQP